MYNVVSFNNIPKFSLCKLVIVDNDVFYHKDLGRFSFNRIIEENNVDSNEDPSPIFIKLSSDCYRDIYSINKRPNINRFHKVQINEYAEVYGYNFEDQFEFSKQFKLIIQPINEITEYSDKQFCFLFLKYSTGSFYKEVVKIGVTDTINDKRQVLIYNNEMGIWAVPFSRINKDIWHIQYPHSETKYHLTDEVPRISIIKKFYPVDIKVQK